MTTSSIVSASATDSDHDTGNQATQTVDIDNIAPTVALAAANDLSVNEGSTHTYGYTISDPGADDVSSVSVSCGSAGTLVGTPTNSNTSGLVPVHVPRRARHSTVSVIATDSDTATGNTPRSRCRSPISPQP